MQLTQKELKKIILEEIENLTNNEQDPKPDEDKENPSRDEIKTKNEIKRRMRTMAVSGMERINDRELPYVERLLDIISYFNISETIPNIFDTKLKELEETLPVDK